MGNFSYLIQKKFRALNSEQQKIFISEFERRKKSVGISYLLWLLLGWHYAYLKKWGWLILYIFTVGGFFIWVIIDLFRIPKMVEQYNNDLALEILRDISIMFPEGRTSDDKDVNKNAVNDLYITQKTQSGESYSFYIIVGIIILFSVSTFLLKPDRATMQNEIADKILLQQPQIFKKMKDFFLGEKSPEEYSQKYIVNTLSRKGYSNVGIYEEDLVLVRKLEYRNEDSKENLITAYGFLGFTKVFFSDENLAEDNFSNKQNENIKDHDSQRTDITRVKSYKPSTGYNYYEEQAKIREKNKVSQHSETEINAPNQQGDSIKIN
ncbi:TM2 domain-containing protein [Chryseobacterium culicis]|uniref:TM2 domain-containing protein n=1 Tax=Chryseobacterium culicis TaxID=680127 RepID=UPI0018740BB1|nr:TM2 domain-containing protein [Chryseobacterium culicis]MBE4950722.1 TM2 domain-containing protein [Chryseobacterium culicis]